MSKLPRVSTKPGTRSLKKPSTRKGVKRKSKFERNVDVYKANYERYDQFLHKSEHWFRNNVEKFELFLSINRSADVVHVTEKSFKSALITMFAPFNKVELDLLVRLIRIEDGKLVRVDRLYERFKEISIRSEKANDLSKELFEKNETHISCHFYCLPCIGLKTHPFHFSTLVRPTSTTLYLEQVIRNFTNLTTPSFRIYLSPLADSGSELHSDQVLSDCWMNRDQQGEVALYYRPMTEPKSDSQHLGPPPCLPVASDMLVWCGSPHLWLEQLRL